MPPFLGKYRDGRSINVFSETRPPDCRGTLIEVRLVQSDMLSLSFLQVRKTYHWAAFGV